MTKSCAERLPRTRRPRTGRAGGAGRWRAIAWAVLVAGWFFGGVAAAQDEVSEKQRELRALKSEIEANRKEIEGLRKQERSLATLKDRLRKDQDLTRRYLRELQLQDSTLRTGLADHQADLLDKEAAARETAARLKRGLVRYYKVRHVQGPELLFSSRTFGELFARSQMMARLIYRERIELAALADERQRIAEAAYAIEQRRLGVERLQAEKRREEERLRREGQKAQSRIEDVRDERAERERRVKDLEASQAAIRRMIERLERERARQREQGQKPAGPGFRRKSLPWPARGEIVGEFGLEVNPKYGTQVRSNGIDISAPEGTPIKAVAAGVVEFVDWLPGYGRTVILDHGGGYYTMYAHASALSVRAQESVAAGQEIGRVGDTDSIKGSCLHFEVREGAKALNPREWLQ